MFAAKPLQFRERAQGGFPGVWGVGQVVVRSSVRLIAR